MAAPRAAIPTAPLAMNAARPAKVFMPSKIDAAGATVKVHHRGSQRPLR
jgi:hypothetical protein